MACAVCLALGAVQLASDAIFTRAGEPPSLPAHLHPLTGVAIYSAVSRVAQAPYVDSMLARAALDRGDSSLALQYARRLPDSAKRDDLLGEIAQAQGHDSAAERYFVRAGDVEAIGRAVDRIGPHDPAHAYSLEYGLKQRLEMSGTHPDAVAEAYWRLGQLAWQQSQRALAMRQYAQAIALSPLSEKYLLSAGFAAYEQHDDASARRYFARVLSVNPASVDAYAGEGMVALRQGDRTRALWYAERARATGARSDALSTLESSLKQ